MLGCDVSVLKRAKRDGAPGFRSNRVYLDEVKTWLDENPVHLDDDTKEGLERRKLRAQCEKLEHELAVTRGQYRHINDIRNDAMRVADLVRVEFLSFLGDLTTWEGLPAVELHERGKKRVNQSLQMLKDALAI